MRNRRKKVFRKESTFVRKGLWLVFLLLAGCASTPDFRTEATTQPQKRYVDDTWHWFQNTWLRPPQELFFHPVRLTNRIKGTTCPAIDVDGQGNPEHSVVWTPRDIASISPSAAARGPNTDAGPALPIRFKKKKKSGTSPGFFGKDARGVHYLFKLDSPKYPEMITRAEFIGSKCMYLLGYNVPEITISQIEGTATEFDGEMAAAVKFVPGKIYGPWSFRLHRDWREVRALKIASAWINNTDIKAPNSLVTWQNGHRVVYLIDFAGSLGSHTYRPKEAREGWEHTFDIRVGLEKVVTLGLWPQPYDRRPKPVLGLWPPRYTDRAKPFSPAVGLFNADFDPDRWKANYSVLPFWSITREDAAWMAKRVTSVSDAQIRAIVKAARYTRKEDADYVAKVLIERRDVIRKTYLTSDTSQ